MLKNTYLGRCLASLKELGGIFFVLGHSLRDEDDHVFNLLLKGKNVKQFFIGLFKPHSKSDDVERIKQKVQDWKTLFPKHQFYFFDSETAHVWDS